MKYLIHPLFLFLIGTLIGISPYIVDSKFFDYYSEFKLNDQILIVYIVGYLSFLLGTLFVSIIYKKRNIKKRNIKKDLNVFILALIFVSILLFFKIISLYGSLPILSIITGNENILHVNETQKDIGGGIFGVFFLLIIMLIVLFPYSLINKEKTKYYKFIFYFHLILLLLYCTYSGKRQMLFVFFTYTFTYLILYYYTTFNIRLMKQLKYYGGFSLVVILILFSVIGSLRSAGENISLINPIIHYASLPYINLTNIITNQDTNDFAYSFASLTDFLLGGLPTFIKSIFAIKSESLQNLPILEPTSPVTFYGVVFWSFSYLGVVFWSFLVGMFSTYLYLKAIYSKYMIYISFYSLLIWPLLSIHTYNHFKNFMFLIIPLCLIYFGHKFYINFIPRKYIVKSCEK